MAPQRTTQKADGPTLTSTRLLDSAEVLFAEFGFNGVSVRDIVEHAGVNLGAIPYHFGSKERLFQAVIKRRALPLHEERARRLKELMLQFETVSVESVLRALLEPALRASQENDAFRRLLGRVSTDPTPRVRDLLAEIYTPDFMLVPRYLRMLWPKMPTEQFYWKLNCFYGVMLFVQADTGKIQSIAGSGFDTTRPETALKYVIPFIESGFQSSI
jgi:AcrR family transcriptional regulator